MHPFRAAVEAGDLSSVPTLLAPDVTFLSPVAFAPYSGRELVAEILRGAARAFEDLRYVREMQSTDGRDHALMFKARIGDREVHGCDFLRHDDSGLIAEFCVMVRPLSAAQAVSAAMAAQFEVIQNRLGMTT